MSAPLLVLGAGPTGLAVAKALADARIDYEQVEARDAVGGNWVDGVYASAHLISSRDTTQYDDFPMPADYPDFPSAAQMRSYFQSYAERFGLLPRIRFGAEVTAVRPDGGRWRVTTADGASQLYRGVVVCNGHHWARSYPAWAEAFTGERLHSKDYKDPAQLAGKRVLVVGGGNSGCDIVSEAARVGASADWGLRRGYWFVPKTVFGRPTIEMLKPWMPVPVQRAVMRMLLPVVVGSYASYGLPTPDHRMFEAHPSVSTEVFHYLKHGRIQPRPDVAEVRGRRVRFVDGRECEYDVVVFATGFDVSFPFLEPGVVPVEGKTPQLLGGMLRPEHRHLWIVGAYQPRYGIGPLLTPLGKLIARWAPLQDELAVPLGRVLADLGMKPPRSHLVDPHGARRQLQLAARLTPVLRWRAKRRGWLVPAADAAANDRAERAA